MQDFFISCYKYFIIKLSATIGITLYDIAVY